mmetsp:Transcript_20878/g.35403  ORF Transcript_20878/g.35403 Transcript_20878/m.35403 type:complete len:266 (+) Transcript_20878:173-970(+)
MAASMSFCKLSPGRKVAEQLPLVAKHWNCTSLGILSGTEELHANAIIIPTISTAMLGLRSSVMILQFTTLLFHVRAGLTPLVRTLHRNWMVAPVPPVLKMSSLDLPRALCLLRMATCLLMPVEHAKPERALQRIVVRSIQEIISSYRLLLRDVRNVLPVKGWAQLPLLKSVLFAFLVPQARLWTARVYACVTMVPLIRGNQWLLQGIIVKRAPQEEGILEMSSTTVPECVRTRALPPIQFTPPKPVLLVLSSCAARQLAVLVMVG